MTDLIVASLLVILISIMAVVYFPEETMWFVLVFFVGVLIVLSATLILAFVNDPIGVATGIIFHNPLTEIANTTANSIPVGLINNLSVNRSYP